MQQGVSTEAEKDGMNVDDEEMSLNILGKDVLFDIY